VQHPASTGEKGAEHQEADVPAQRAAQIVTDVVHAQELMVDEPLDQVEAWPPGGGRP
jgi:hypothetical protein